MDGGREHKRRKGKRERGAVLEMQMLREVCWLKAEREDRKGE